MKNKIILAAMFCLAFAVAVSAQDTAKPTDTTAAKPADFSGKWVLDVSKSKLDERQRIESMTLTVAQTDKDIKTVSDIKRTPPKDGMTPGGGRGGMGGGLAGAGPDSHTFGLDGKETTEEVAAQGGMPGPTIKRKAELKKDGTLGLTVTRKISSQMGEFEIVVKDTWSLSTDGKTLTIDRDQTTPRGSMTSKMVLTKN